MIRIIGLVLVSSLFLIGEGFAETLIYRSDGLSLRYALALSPSSSEVWVIQDGDGTVRTTYHPLSANVRAKMLSTLYGVSVVIPELRREYWYARDKSQYCALDFEHRTRDLNVLLDSLRKEMPSKNRIFLIGFSAGADVVTKVANRRNEVSGVVTVGGGVLQLWDYFKLLKQEKQFEGNLRNECHVGHFENRSGLFWRELFYSGLYSEIAEAKVPYLAVFGGTDPIVSFEVSKPHAEELRRRNPRFAFQVIHGMGHGFGMNPFRWRLVKEWTSRNLAKTELPASDPVHFVDPDGNPLPQYEPIYQKVAARFPGSMPRKVTLEVLQWRTSRFDCEQNRIIASMDQMDENAERTISHELSHLALCQLSGHANTEEPFRFLDEGYVTVIEEDLAGNLLKYRNERALPTAYAHAQFGSRVAEMQKWTEFFGAPSLRPCQPTNWGAYDAGASFVLYLIERFGREAFHSLFGDIGTTRSLTASVARVYGVKLQDLEDGWLGFVRGAEMVLPPTMPVQAVAYGFSFSPGRSCEGGWIGSSWCEATEPKPWTEVELAWMTRLLSGIVETGPQNFFRTVREKGFSTIYRYGHAFQPKGNNQYVREEHGAWVWGRDNSINVSDLGFAFGVLKDPRGGFDLQSEGLLHEMTHAFAFGDGMLLRDFALKAGWIEQDGRCFLPGVDAGEIAETVSRMRSLILSGQIDEAIRLNRNFGMKHGFPTAYAMSSPSEGLAEVASHLHFDPKASTYLRPELVTWIRERVLR